MAPSRCRPPPVYSVQTSEMPLCARGGAVKGCSRPVTRGERPAAPAFCGCRALGAWACALPLPLVVMRRKFLPAPKGGSDVQLQAAPVEAVFDAAMALERMWLRGVGRLPWGSSLLAVARKPGD